MLGTGITLSLTAQESTFSQYLSNPLFLNPAYAGSTNCSQFAAQYRNGSILGSWGLDQSLNASYDQPLGKSSAVGLQFTYERLADVAFQNFCLDAVYAHNFQISEKFSFRPGISLGVLREHVDWERFLFYDQILHDTVQVFPKDNITVFDLKLGFLIKYQKLTAGISIDHLNKPKYTFIEGSEKNELTSRLFMHIDYRAKINEKFSITPGLVIDKYLVRNSEAIYLPSLKFDVNKLTLGLATRIFNDQIASVIGMAGYSGKKIGGLISYDINNKRYFYQNTLEVTAYYRFGCK